ncbi:MAG: hypothetical protein LHW45_00340 [Candidatus Cloacimonetes bacterium]|nr:hypothetical protein [Candidatus Cloacimonadota bacterium]MDY0366068.1 hypothetical protein [Candidatus Syntrophosphaera sp.]
MKLIYKIGLAIALFYAANWIVYGALQQMGAGETNYLKINSIQRTQADVYIFGASRALRHYNPAIISSYLSSSSVYNAGVASSNAAYQYCMLNLLLENHTPEAILYEIGDLGKNLDGAIADFFPYYDKNKEVHEVLRKRDPLAGIKFAIPLYAMNQKIFGITHAYLNSSDSSIEGFIPRRGTLDLAQIPIARQTDKKLQADENFDPLAWNYFVRFANLCRDKNITLIYLYSPRYTMAKPVGFDLIKNFSEDHSIELLDFSEDRKYLDNAELFVDWHHLNEKGADIFSNDVGIAVQKSLHEGKRCLAL